MAWTNPATRASNYKVTASNWNELVNNSLFLAEIGYQEFTSTVSSTATTVGTAVQIVSLGAITYTNNPIMLEFFTERVNSGATTAYGILRDGTTVLGTWLEMPPTTQQSVYIVRRLTPTAASHSYNVACWNVGAATTSFNAGTGGAAGDTTTRLPGFIRATNLPT